MGGGAPLTHRAVIESDSVSVLVPDFTIFYPISMWFGGIIKDIRLTPFTMDGKA